MFKSLTEKEYAKVYKTFKLNSRQDEIVRNEITNFMLNKYGDISIDMMSIGTGTGWLEDHLIRHPALQIKSTVVIEPNPDHAEKLREKSIDWKDTVFQIDSSYFDANFEIEKKFDVILMIHSIYYIKNPIDSIIKAKSFLKPRGHLVIVAQGENCPFQFTSYLHNQAKIVPSEYSYIPISAQFVVNGLKSNNIKYEIEEVMDDLDVTDFIERNATPTSNDTISFLMQSMYEELDEKFQDDIYAIVRKGTHVSEDKRYIMNNSNNFIFVENSGKES